MYKKDITQLVKITEQHRKERERYKLIAKHPQVDIKYIIANIEKQILEAIKMKNQLKSKGKKYSSQLEILEDCIISLTVTLKICKTHK